MGHQFTSEITFQFLGEFAGGDAGWLAVNIETGQEFWRFNARQKIHSSPAVDGDKVTVDGANVTTTDIECSNGVIHVIDAVILPK